MNRIETKSNNFKGFQTWARSDISRKKSKMHISSINKAKNCIIIYSELQNKNWDRLEVWGFLGLGTRNVFELNRDFLV